MLSNRTANVIILVVTVVWVANFVATLAITTYNGSAINAIFTAIVGGVFALKGRKAQEKNDGERNRKEDADG